MGMVLPRSIGHNDVIRLDGRDYKVVHRIYRTTHMFGFNLYPMDVEPGGTIADLVWFIEDEKIERIRRW